MNDMGPDPLSPELQSLLEMEKARPAPAAIVRDRVMAKLGRSLVDLAPGAAAGASAAAGGG